MPKIFVDTAAWIAIADADDELHDRAEQVLNELLTQRVQLVTTELVLLEVADALAAPYIRSRTINFINRLRQAPILKVIPVDQALLDVAWILYSQRLDKGWGLTDCTSFVVMTRERLTQAFTSDRHFEQAGFVKLL